MILIQEADDDRIERLKRRLGIDTKVDGHIGEGIASSVDRTRRSTPEAGDPT